MKEHERAHTIKHKNENENTRAYARTRTHSSRSRATPIKRHIFSKTIKSRDTKLTIWYNERNVKDRRSPAFWASSWNSSIAYRGFFFAVVVVYKFAWVSRSDESLSHSKIKKSFAPYWVWLIFDGSRANTSSFSLWICVRNARTNTYAHNYRWWWLTWDEFESNTYLSYLTWCAIWLFCSHIGSMIADAFVLVFQWI